MTTTQELLIDGDGLPIPPLVQNDPATRAYFAGKVRALKCPHYMAKSERDAGFEKCERCS